MATTGATISDNVGVTDRRAGGVAYYFAAIGTSLIAGTVVDAGLNVTRIAALAAWGITTLAMMPGRIRAGRGLFLAITVLLIMKNFADLTTEGRFWAGANLVILLSVFAIQPLNRTRGFPFLHIWCLVEAIYVYMSGLISTPYVTFVWTFTPDVRTLGYKLLFFFNLTVVVVGLVMTRGFGLNRAPNKPRQLPPAAIPRAYVLIVLGNGLVGIASVLKMTSQLGSILGAFHDIGYAGVLILALIWMQGNLATGHKIVVLAIAFATALVGLGDGALYESAIPGFLLLGLFISYRRSVPWAMILVALLVFTVLNVQKQAFRHDTWYGASDASSSELGVTWIQQSADSLSTTDESALTQSAHRFANSDLLGYVAKWAPDRYPYMGYQAYTTLPLVLVPRVLYPDKGAFNFENEFGRDYELIGRSDYNTTVNTPLHVEAYLAGGPAVMFAVAVFSGFYLALIGFALKRGSPAGIITGCTLTYSVVLSIESGILSFLLTLPFMLFLYPILWWATRDQTLEEVRASWRERARAKRAGEAAAAAET